VNTNHLPGLKLALSLGRAWFLETACASACIRVDGGSHCSLELSRQRRPRRRKHPAQLPPVYQGDCLHLFAKRGTAKQSEHLDYM